MKKKTARQKPSSFRERYNPILSKKIGSLSNDLAFEGTGPATSTVADNDVIVDMNEVEDLFRNVNPHVAKWRHHKDEVGRHYVPTITIRST